MELNRTQKALDTMFNVIQRIFPFAAAIVVGLIVWRACS